MCACSVLVATSFSMKSLSSSLARFRESRLFVHLENGGNIVSQGVGCPWCW